MRERSKLSKKHTYCFVDASNLFYGGEKSLGWKIDYQKLIRYLRKKYNLSKCYYYAGVETYDFEYEQNSVDLFPIDDLVEYLQEKLRREKKKLSDARIVLLERDIQRAKFYRKLEEFGYILKLKRIKTYFDEEGQRTRKANCDVDLTFDVMRLFDKFDRIVMLSGDGDFAILLRYLQEKGKSIVVLARGERTAREIRQLVRGDFRDFHRIRHRVEFFDQK